MNHKEIRNLDSLRKRAVNLLENMPERFGADDRKDTSELVQEILIYQAELEIQFENLQDSQTKLHNLKDTFAGLFENAPVAYMVLDKNGLIKRVNKAFCNLIKHDCAEIHESPFADFLEPESRHQFLSRFSGLYRSPLGKGMILKLDSGYNSPIVKLSAHHSGPVLETQDQNGKKEQPLLYVALNDVSELFNTRRELMLKNEELEEANQTSNRINSILKVIRSVNRLINEETDPDALIQKASEHIADNIGYSSAWILRYGSSETEIQSLGFSGDRETRTKFEQQISENSLSVECYNRVRKSSSLSVIPEPSVMCRNCCLNEQYENQSALSKSLQHQGKTYGMVTVSIPRGRVHDSEEQQLFAELADDLAFGLHKLENERLLSKSERDLRRSQEMAGVGSWTFDLKAGKAYPNTEARRMFGLSTKVLTIEQAQTIPLAGYRDSLKTDLHDLLENGKPFEQEFEIRRVSDGEIRHIRAFAEYDPAGGVIFGTVLDVTASKVAEEAIMENRERYRLLSDLTIEGILLHSNGRAIELNSTLEKMLGFSREEMIGKNALELIHPDDLGKVKEQLLLDVAPSYRARLRRKDGEYFIAEIESRNFKYQNEIRRVTAIRDVTEKYKAELELKASEEKHRNLLENLQIAIVVYDAEGKIRFLNQRASTLFAINRDTTIGNDLTEHGLRYLDENETQISLDDYPIKSILKDGIPVRNRVLGLRQDNSEEISWLLVNAFPQFNGRNEINEIIETYVDISSHRRTEAALEKRLLALAKPLSDVSSVAFDDIFNIKDLQRIQDQLAETLKVSSVITDPQGNELTITSQNTVWVNLLESEVEEDSQRVWYHLQASPGTILFNGKHFSIHCTQFGTAFAIAPIRIGGKLIANWIIGQVRLTDQRLQIAALKQTSEIQVNKAYEALTCFNHEEFLKAGELLEMLANKFSDLAYQNIYQAHIMKELRSEKEAAECANRSKDEFLAMMSHEMRTPLNAIMGFAELLMMEPLSIPVKSHVDTILSAGKQQLKLIDNILQYARLDRSSMKPLSRSFDALALAQSVIENNRRSAAHLTVEIQNGFDDFHPIPTNLEFFTDPDLLREILENFVGNAIKYTKSGSVTLKIGIREHSNRKTDLTFVVEDTGIGIPEEKINHIFEAFYQTDSSYKREFEGAGLGLAICRKLADVINAKLGVESSHGKGSKFSLTLETDSVVRQKESQEKKSESPAIKPVLPDNFAVLVVDDRPTNLKIARIQMEHFGAKAMTANSGVEALKLTQKQRFDLILMDLNMPNMDGFETLSKIRAQGGLNVDTPVYALTADVTSETAELCAKAGMVGRLEKPILSKELHKAISKFVQTAELQ